MKGIMLIVLIAFELTLIAPAQAQICKWVDDEGVTHYETKCPDQGKPEVLDLNTTPSEDSVDEGQQETEKSSQEFSALKAEPGSRSEIALAPPQPSVLQNPEARANCVRATTNLVTLQMAAPVFYDDQDVLRYGWSASAKAYEGVRTYVDDQDREGEIRKYDKYLSANCGQSEREREQIAALVAEQSLPALRDEICTEKEHLLSRMSSGSTGLPVPTSRRLAQYIGENCY